MIVNFHQVRDVLFPIFASTFTASVIHSAFPPWDAEPFKPFPTFQKYYRAFIYVMGYVAINLRSTVHKSISIHNPDGLNANPEMDQPKETP